MKNKANIVIIIALISLGIIAAANFYVYAPDIGQPGGPINGLSVLQLKKFYEARKVFKKTFSVKEGLGPLYIEQSCYTCHGSPGIIGNQGTAVASLTYIASPMKDIVSVNQKPENIKFQDSDFYLHEGGPVLITKSITDTFANSLPDGCTMPAGQVPDGAKFVSSRIAPPLWGMGLIDAIPEDAIEDLEFKQDDNLATAGLSVSHRDRFTHQDRLGKFGYKAQYASLLDAIVEQLNTTLGITTKYDRTIRTAGVNNNFPDCLKAYLPKEPNDAGQTMSNLAYFLALAAPPPPGIIDNSTNSGRVSFEKLGCASCHVPTYNTASEYYLLDPDSQFPTKRYLRIQALENKEVNAYSDFLLHNMGPTLADGIATPGGVSGGQWRTTPLWGLRFRKYYLHDGRTTSLTEAILAHGGQGQAARDKFAALNENEKNDLLLFLKSL